MLTESQRVCCLRLHEIAAAHGTALYAVGGIVRDLLRGVNPEDRDLDIVVEGNALDFAQLVQASVGGKLDLFKNFYTAKVSMPGKLPGTGEIDFASTRTEIYRSPGALPEVSLADLHEDLKRRDFSINAIALPLRILGTLNSHSSTLECISPHCIDLFGGIEDLRDKLIRILHPGSFEDDPTRLFRALRYRSRIGGEFEGKTRDAFVHSVHQHSCDHISLRRQINEIVKMLDESASALIIRSAEDEGLFASSAALSQLGSPFHQALHGLAALPLPLRTFSAVALREATLMSVLNSLPQDARDAVNQELSISKEQRRRFAEELSMISAGSCDERCSAAGLLLLAALSPASGQTAIERLRDLAGGSETR